MPHPTLIKKLQSSQAFDHPTPRLGLIETHVSWVILTGEYAYKIKKPVNFEFLDFSTLEKRRYYCEEELRLGQRFAPEIYLSVIPITGIPEQPHVNGSGSILEYALRMREFSQENLFSTLLKRDQLTEGRIEELAKLIAEFHKKTPSAPSNTRFGLPQEVHAPTQQNFKQISPLLSHPSDIEQLKRLEQWTNQQFKKYHALLKQRKEKGFIRDCHGDLHLANIILYKGKPVLFDRLEFNEDLRWTDVMADLAFLLMDLAEKKQIKLANQLLNTYLQFTGDYQGLYLLPYYLVYRAIVRAKIALFRLQQENLSPQEKKEAQKDYYNFINLAESYTQVSHPCLIIMHGLSGSGKTTTAKEVIKQCGGIQINSDRIRKQLFNNPIQTSPHANLYESGIYTSQATKKTYQELAKLAKITIKAGFTALIDATFLYYAQRTLFYHLAKQLKVRFYILHCQTQNSEIKERIQHRLNDTNSLSEADLNILSEQKKIQEPLTKVEKDYQLIINKKKISLKTALEKICPSIY